MKRKLTAMILVFTMLASLSPAVAADEMSATPTVEEILSEYYQKAFEAQAHGDTDTSSTWSRRGGNAKTLEQETVDTLTNAGYEAYNVTADDYDTLEAELNTDFAVMGLDPEGSYIVVISGEDIYQTDSTDGASTFNISPLPEWDQAPDGGGGTYFMRYVTIVATDVGGTTGPLFQNSTYYMSDIEYLNEIAGVLGEYVFTAAGEKFIESLLDEGSSYIPDVGPICTLASLFVDVGGVILQDPLTELDPNALIFTAGTSWTRSYTQVYNSDTGNWHTAQCSSYAVSEASFSGGYFCHPETSLPTEFRGVFHSSEVYSPYYNNTEQRKLRAVQGYLDGCIYYDGTGPIEFFFAPPDDSDTEANAIMLFTHTESVETILPVLEE